MTSDGSAEMWKRAYENQSGKGRFPMYFVAQPPHRDGLTPVYYKVMAPDGTVFWRRAGDDTGQKSSFFDLLMECKNGLGIDKVDKKHTPWADD